MPTAPQVGRGNEGQKGTHYLLAALVLLSGRGGSDSIRRLALLLPPSSLSLSLPPSHSAHPSVRPFHESRAVQPVMLFIQRGRSRSAFILVHSILDAFLSSLSLDSLLDPPLGPLPIHIFIPLILSFSLLRAVDVG